MSPKKQGVQKNCLLVTRLIHGSDCNINCCWAHADRLAVFVHRRADSVMEVVVYRGLGGEHLSISEPWPHALHYGLQSVKEIIAERTHWLWGIDDAYLVLDMLTAQVLSWDHQFAVRGELVAPHLIQIIYLSYRITNQGFPCRTCMLFVFWDQTWFTKYHILSKSFQPRNFYCYSCGNKLASYDFDMELIDAGQVAEHFNPPAVVWS